MATTKQAKEKGLRATATLIDAFHANLASSKGLPSSRCLSHTALLDLVLKSRDSTDSPIVRELSGVQLIQLLVDAAVAHPIPLEPGGTKKQAKLYAIGFNTAAVTIPPAELLQAHIPNGILCYFTAIELHALTTQPAPYYHIATQRASPADPTASKPAAELPRSDKPLPLGITQFTFEGVTYYSTSRDPTNLVGVQRRQLNPYCVVTVTTLEQTLLDCLHRPRSSGGPAVIFEAWETALQRTTPEKVLALALRIDDKTLLRRAGYMIERYQPDASEIREIKRVLGAASSPDNIPTLLPGVPYQRMNPIWGLRTP